MAAFDLAIISGQGAVFAEVSHLLTVAASDSGRVAGLVAFFADMTFFTTVTAGVAPTCRAIFGEVAHCTLSEKGNLPTI